MLNKEEIEEAKGDLKRELTDEDRREYFSNWFAKDLDVIVEYIDQLEQENKKLNKMIDEMIDEYELYGRYNLKEFCDEKIRENKCIEYCLECIKQYFEKKVDEN